MKKLCLVLLVLICFFGTIQVVKAAPGKVLDLSCRQFDATQVQCSFTTVSVGLNPSIDARYRDDTLGTIFTAIVLANFNASKQISGEPVPQTGVKTFFYFTPTKTSMISVAIKVIDSTGSTLSNIPPAFKFNGPAVPVSVTLAWDESDGAVGYRIYVGTITNNYISSVDVGNVTSYTFPNLPRGYTYFFAATAYDAANSESGFSDEVKFPAL